MTSSGLARILSKARRTLQRRGASEEDAEELVQEAFLRISQYEGAHAARSKEALLVTAAVNLSIDRARRRGRAPMVAADDLSAIADGAPDAAQVLEQRARLRRVAEGIELLPERTRRILLARRLDNLSYKEIAEAEGMSVPAVEKQVARATLRLMEWMDGW